MKALVTALVSLASRLLRRPALWPLLVGLLAVVVMVPLTWSYGFWDPYELKVFDRAQEYRQTVDVKEVVAKARRGQVPRSERQPPLTTWAIGKSVARLGIGELPARLPLLALAVVALLATFLAGRRLQSPRAGLLAALALLSSPLFLFQARQLTSSIGQVAGDALMIFGWAGLLVAAAPSGPGFRLPAPARVALDAAAVAIGAALSYATSGALVGVVGPSLAAAVAAVPLVVDRFRAGDRGGRRWLPFVAGCVALAAAAAVVLWVAHAAFDVVEAAPGQRAVFGNTLRASKEYVPAIAGTWRSQVPASVGWDALVEQAAFGIYPWAALAPLALAALAVGVGCDDEATRSRTRAGRMVFAWTGCAWLVATLAVLKIGLTRFPGLVPLALAVGLWLDRWLRDLDEQGEAAARPLAGLFVLMASVVLAHDVFSFPEKLVTLHMPGVNEKYTGGFLLKAVPLAIGLGFGAAMSAALLFGVRPRPAGGTAGPARRRGWLDDGTRWGAPLAVTIALVSGVFFSWGWTPRLSRDFSKKNLFATYQQLRRPGDKLGVLGLSGSGADYYAGTEYEKLRSRADLIRLLHDPARVFALAPFPELCAVNQAAGADGVPYYILDDSSAQYMLLSNRLGSGETDRNPLGRAFRHEPPTDIDHPLSVDFDGQIELIGWSGPAAVDKGDDFSMTFFYKVTAKPTKNWKVFVHFDRPEIRFQGDHDPINGRCGTMFWKPGDYVVDTFTVTAGGMTYPTGTFQIWAGLFVGSGGNWTNMKALSGNPDKDNRVPIGSIRVR